MLEWIRQGMPWGSSDAPRLIGLRVEPQERVIHVGGRMRILATAIYSDGRERDVTAAAAYASNASQLAEVDAQGRVQVGLTPGQATITVAYMGQVGAVRLLMPRAGFGRDRAAAYRRPFGDRSAGHSAPASAGHSGFAGRGRSDLSASCNRRYCWPFADPRGSPAVSGRRAAGQT